VVFCFSAGAKKAKVSRRKFIKLPRRIHGTTAWLGGQQGPRNAFEQTARSPVRRTAASEPVPIAPRHVRHHRTLFISDTHLGTRGAKADLLADFLAHNECETLYLVGDIVDGWQLKRSWFWSAAQTRVVELILRKIEAGTKVIYVPGNHDEMFRPYCGLALGVIEIRFEDVFETADGRKMLVVHGDSFDGIVTYAKWLAKFGAQAYETALALNTVFNRARRKLGLSYWSRSGYLKHTVKNAGAFIAKFERAVADEARMRGFDGVICGHIHHAEMKMVAGILYCNDGDWVESCTALAEDHSGRLALVRWTEPVVAEAGERAGAAVSAAA
jgi:UDP-2,3-diacylglucosamine pyrophosphatase LpxH